MTEKVNTLKSLAKFLSNNKNLSDEFITTMLKDNYMSEEYWQNILELSPLTTQFILNNINVINLKYLIKYQSNLTEDCLTNYIFMNKIIEDDLVIELMNITELPVECIKYYATTYEKDKLFWKTVSLTQSLSYDFINIYNDKLDMDYISKNKDSTLDTIIKNINDEELY